MPTPNRKEREYKEAQLAEAVVIYGCATTLVLKTATTYPKLSGLEQPPCYLWFGQGWQGQLISVCSTYGIAWA